jgi:hypothetical protein
LGVRRGVATLRASLAGAKPAEANSCC